MTKKKKIWLIVLTVIVVGFLIHEGFKMPVKGAHRGDYNPQSFWYNWGGRPHLGIDVFAKKGTPIHSPTWCGLAFRLPKSGKGGNSIVMLGPKWRFHYFSHLDEISIGAVAIVGHGTKIGTVGSTGNAAGKPAHLHYSIVSMIPYPWRIDRAQRGYLKMFYLDPTPKLDRSVGK